MSNIKTLFLVLVLANVALGQHNRARQNSTWIFPVTSTIYDSLALFSNGKYVQFDAEIKEHFYGSYKIAFDTLFLFLQRGQYDAETVPEHRKGNALEKYLMRGDSLQLVYWRHSLLTKPHIVSHANASYRKVK